MCLVGRYAGSKESDNNSMRGKYYAREPKEDNPLGRYPANVMHDGLQEEWARYFYCPKTSTAEREESVETPTKKMGMSNGAQIHGEGYDKAQSIGLNKVVESNNTHPTVKPVELMRYLCRAHHAQGGNSA